MPVRNAKRKKPGPARRTGGRPRGQHEVQDLVEQVEDLMLHRQGRHAIARALHNYLRDVMKKAGGTEAEIAAVTAPGMSTVDAYMKRVRDRWADEAKATRDETREVQIRRLNRKLFKAYADKRYRDAIDNEKLIAKVEGNEAPTELSGPGGGPIPVKTVPEAIGAFQRLVEKKA